MPAYRAFFSSLYFKAILAMAVIAVGDWLFYQRHAFGSGFGLFAATLSLVALAGRPAIVRDRVALLAWVVSLGFAAALVLDPSLLAWLLFGASLGVAIVKPRAGPFDDAWRWFQRLFWQVLTSPVLPLLDMLKIQTVRWKRRRKGRATANLSLRKLLTTMGLPLIGTAIFLGLFASANPVIQQWFNLSIAIDDWLIIRMALWGFLSLFAWNALRPRLPRHLIASFDGTGDLAIPGVTVASVTLSLLMFNALFALQNIMDIAWLWGLAPLPEGMTLADYAHRGAYPLIVTALLAGLFVLVTLRPGSQTAAAPGIRWLVIAWVAQNMLLVASSALRTIDYIEAYSLTLLRLAALEWMGLVALGLVFILWRLLAGKSGPWLINANAGAALLLLSVATVVDHGTIVARWNTTHARDVGGKGVALDLCYLHNLGESALLPLIDLEVNSRLSPGLRERVIATRRAIRERMQSAIDNGRWTLRNRDRTMRADAAVAGRPVTPIAAGPRDCHGGIVTPLWPPTVAAPVVAAALSANRITKQSAHTAPKARTPLTAEPVR
jgi:hypothetical protein